MDMYERIVQNLRTGKGFSFMLSEDLLNRLYHNFWYDTHWRVNNYHICLKLFHQKKYGAELVNGQDFGLPGDRCRKIIGMEYEFFCASKLNMRDYEIDRLLGTVTVKPMIL